jgi:hypothetical protein
MIDKLKAFALRILFSRLGPSISSSVSVVVGFLLGWVVNATSALDFHMDANQQTQFSLAATTAIYWLIGEITNKYAGQHAKALQEVLQSVNPTLKADRWIGPETIAAAQEAAQKAAANPSTGEIYEGKAVAPTLTEKATQAQAKLKPKPKRKTVQPFPRK